MRRIYCVGRNYEAHAREMGHDPDREPPFFFTKPADAVLYVAPGATGEFPYPAQSKNVHFEMELVAAIGKGGTNIPADSALDHVYGYALGLDMTRRDLQAEAKKLGRPWDTAKGFDHSAPLGPIHPVTTVGHLDKGAIWLSVNGEEKQRSDVSQLIWSVARDDRVSVDAVRTAARRSDFHRHAGRRRRGGAGRSDEGWRGRARRIQRARRLTDGSSEETDNMKLYSYFRSSASYRVRIALNVKGLPYDYAPVHLVRDGGEQLQAGISQGECGRHRADARSTATRCCTQSLAIIEYLEETHPEPPLLPRAPADRAYVRAIALQVACEIHPLEQSARAQVSEAHAETSTTTRKTPGIGIGSRAGFASLEKRIWPATRAPASCVSAIRRPSPISASCRRCSTRSASRST